MVCRLQSLYRLLGLVKSFGGSYGCLANVKKQLRIEINVVALLYENHNPHIRS